MRNLHILIFPILISILPTESQRHLEQLQNRDAELYKNFEILDSDGRFIVEWIVHWDQKRIVFKVTCMTKGYVALGLSKHKRMQGADMVIGGVLPNGNSYFSDRYAVDHAEPLVDKSQDWELHQAHENTTHTTLTFSRPLQTCDLTDDYQINEHDMTHLIWGYGRSDNPAEYHTTQNRGHYPVYLLDPNVIPRSLKESSFREGRPPRNALAKEKLRLWTVSTRYRLVPKETVYRCTLHNGPRLGTKHHIVGWRVRTEPKEDLKIVHHIVLYRCIPPSGSNASFFEPFVGSRGEECYFLSRPSGKIPTQYCTHVTSAMAVGGRVVTFPDHVGMPFGYSPEEYYVLQVHYDNAEKKANVDLDMHLDMYYTSQLRPHELGLMTIGHHVPGSPSLLIPPKTNSHIIYGHCGESCTKSMLPPEGIKIFMLVLHTHFSGRRIRIHHFRGNQELPWISQDDNYDGSYQAFRLLNNEVNIKPGDHVMIRCDFDSTWKNGSVIGGYSANQEMCLTYMFYYNRLEDYSLCRSEVADDFYMRRYLGVNNITWDFSQLGYVATSPRDLAGLTLEEIANTKVSWTDQLRRELQQDHISIPQVNACSKSPFSSTGKGQVQDSTGKELVNLVSIPSGINEYTRTQTNCS